jgi:hypothetical protein
MVEVNGTDSGTIWEFWSFDDLRLSEPQPIHSPSTRT